MKIIIGLLIAATLVACDGIKNDDTIHYILGSDSYFIKTDSAVYIYNREGVIQSVTPLTKTTNKGKQQ